MGILKKLSRIMKKLLRSQNKMIAGVAAGVGNYVGIDPTVMRLIWVVSALVTFSVTFWAYIICWIVIPKE